MELMVLSFIADEHQSQDIPHAIATGGGAAFTVGIFDDIGEDIRRVLYEGVGIEGFNEPAASFLFPVVYLALRHTLVDDIGVIDLLFHIQMQFQYRVTAVELTAVFAELLPFRCVHTSFGTEGVVHDGVRNRPFIAGLVFQEEISIVKPRGTVLANHGVFMLKMRGADKQFECAEGVAPAGRDIMFGDSSSAQ